MAWMDRTHSKPEPTTLGKLIAALEKIQILLAKEDFDGVWLVAEKAIQLGTNRH
jgi:hypothetical protein